MYTREYLVANSNRWTLSADILIKLTRNNKNTLYKPIIEEKHSPLAFLSTYFAERKENWLTYEHEAFVVFQAFRKFD